MGHFSLSFLLNYLKENDEEFLAEEVIRESRGIVPEPPTERAWGGVFQKAARAGRIVLCGYRVTRNPKAHMSPKRLWRRA